MHTQRPSSQIFIPEQLLFLSGLPHSSWPMHLIPIFGIPKPKLINCREAASHDGDEPIQWGINQIILIIITANSFF